MAGIRLSAATGASGNPYTLQSVTPSTAPPSTVMFWAYLTTDRNNYSCPISWENVSGLCLAVLSTDVDGTTMRAWSGNVSTSSTANRAMTAGNWYRFAVVTTATTSCTFYHGDATLTNTLSFGTRSGSGASVFVSNATLFWVGNYNAGQGWNGRIACVKMWNAALTQAELESEFKRHRPVRMTNLLRWNPTVHTATYRNAANDADIWAPDLSGNSRTTDASQADGLFHLDSWTHISPTGYEDGPPIPW